jgi:hypothetical protein
MVTEIIIYKLKKGKEEEYWDVFENESLPMLKRWGVDVVKYGFSIDDKSSFHLIRRYKDLEHRNKSQDIFYNSSEWKDGPREKILASIDYYNKSIFESEDVF